MQTEMNELTEQQNSAAPCQAAACQATAYPAPAASEASPATQATSLLAMTAAAGLPAVRFDAEFQGDGIFRRDLLTHPSIDTVPGDMTISEFRQLMETRWPQAGEARLTRVVECIPGSICGMDLTIIRRSAELRTEANITGHPQVLLMIREAMLAMFGLSPERLAEEDAGQAQRARDQNPWLQGQPKDPPRPSCYPQRRIRITDARAGFSLGEELVLGEREALRLIKARCAVEVEPGSSVEVVSVAPAAPEADSHSRKMPWPDARPFK